MDPEEVVDGFLYQLAEERAVAVINVNGQLLSCPFSLFFLNNEPAPAKDLPPKCHLRICRTGSTVKAVHIVGRRSMDSVTVMRKPPSVATVEDSRSVPRQLPSFQVARMPTFIDTPENMKVAYEEAKSEEVFSTRIFPIWIMSEDIGRNSEIVRNMDTIEEHFAGFRRISKGEHTFYMAVGVGLVQGLLFPSTPQEHRTACLNRLPILSNFVRSPVPSPLRALTNLQCDKNTWSALTHSLHSTVTAYLRDNPVLANYVTEEDFNSKEASQVLIIATAEALGIRLEVYSPRNTSIKVACDGDRQGIQVALIKDGDCYYPLLTLKELMEGSYDVFTCSFLDDLPIFHPSYST